MTKSAFATLTAAEFFDYLKFRLYHRYDNELRDALTDLHSVGGIATVPA
jgi:hypothetical protein